MDNLNFQNDTYSGSNNSDRMHIVRSNSNNEDQSRVLQKICKTLRYISVGCAIVVGLGVAALQLTPSNRSYRNPHLQNALMTIIKQFYPHFNNNHSNDKDAYQKL